MDSLCVQIGPTTDNKILKLKARVVRKTEEGIGCCFTDVTSEQEKEIKAWIEDYDNTFRMVCLKPLH